MTEPNMKNWKLPELLNSPLGLMVALGSLIAAAEFLIMVIIHDVIAPLNVPDVYWDFIDTILLTLIVSPALYFLVFRKMHESEQRYRNIIQTSMDCFWLVDTEGCILDVNDAYCQLSGYTREELLNMRIPDVEANETLKETAQHILEVIKKGYDRFETQHRRKDGQLLDFEVSVVCRQSTKGGRFFIFLHDITERKQAEKELRIAAIAFESQEGMMVTDVDSVILRVNHAFTGITGYTTEEAVGQTPRLLKSGRQDTPFYAAMWKSIQRNGSWQGEIWNRRKNGEVYPEQLTITAVKGEAGEITHYVATLHDITLRKTAEEKIHNLAFYDALTQLPNRRMLNDRLGQTMAASKRSGRYGALMFLDLDNFKPLNDTHGHDVGDLLLIEVARRITGCIRQVDTVARFGGDEFVVMLSELDVDKTTSTTQAEIVAEKIRATLAEPYVLTIRREGSVGTTVEHRCTSSIGAVLFINHEASLEDILKWADMAMYQAKEGGRNRINFFDQTIQSAS